MDNSLEVKQFLMSRRARITPQVAGVEETVTRRRRVEGLRREEVARLAGMSVDYYTRLERGNLKGASESVLNAIARALQLDEAEQEHLHELARAANPVSPLGLQAYSDTPVRRDLQSLLDTITGAPAIIGNDRHDLVAANLLGWAMYSVMLRRPGRPVNFSRHIFLDETARDFYPDWEKAAWMNVTILRREAGRRPRDKRLAALIGELSMQSEDFRRLWASHDVRKHYTGVKNFTHHVVGPIEVTFQSLELTGDPGLTMTVYTPTPGSASAEAIRLLASWAATECAERADSRAAGLTD